MTSPATIAAFALFAGMPTVAYAAASTSDYLLIEDLPFIGQAVDLGSYLSGLFRLGIGIAVTLAIIMIVMGGIQYMFSDVPGVKGNAKSSIWNAVWGLVLIFASWLILNTINPNIVQFDFIESLNRAAGEAAERASTPPPATEDDSAEIASRYDLETNYFGVLTQGNICTSPEDTRCTNTKDLPKSAKQILGALAQVCEVRGCIIITGGAEAGHETHGPGKNFVDLKKTSGLNEIITSFSGDLKVRETCAGKVYTHGRSGTLEFLDEGSHWHACLGVKCQIKAECDPNERY